MPSQRRYRSAIGRRPDLYASLDVAIMRAIMGEDLKVTLSARERTEWIAHINSFARSQYGTSDGRYEDTYGHDPLHANGMVIGALGVLGGRQAHPVRLYDAFDTSDNVAAWLETVDWQAQ